jgi:L-Ala-D/L-Glu epimerase
MELRVETQVWPLRKPFRTAHGAKTDIPVVVATLEERGATGRGEAAGVGYLGETVETMTAQIETVRKAIEAGVDREGLRNLLPAGGARGALDCALWDFEAKHRGVDVWSLAGVAPRRLRTVYTIGLDDLEAMRADAANSTEPLLKIKIDARDPLAQVRVVREARPDARLVVDANQGLSLASLADLLPGFAALGVEMIEQPLPPGEDGDLRPSLSDIPICADESCQTSADLEYVAARYAMVNIKLDKAGGLTEALRMARMAREMGLRLMVGCMAATSLSMAPAFVVGCLSEYLDIDGPLLLARDRAFGLQYRDGEVQPPTAALWG